MPLLGNRVARFVWNGTSLVFDRNLINLRAFQADGAPTPPGQGDASQAPRGVHNGGPMRFGNDGRLYVQVGDVARRGQMQNLPSGPTATGLGPTVPDDQFGGPMPDDEHFSSVVLRLNADGSTPTDNPFYSAGAQFGGQAGRNIQKIFAYGVRNGFGLAVDPYSGNLWDSQNGEDSFDELNRLTRGANLGWIQMMGPSARYSQYRQIESTTSSPQLRWPLTRLAASSSVAVSRMLRLPGSHYDDPEFSWRYPLSPTALGFLQGTALGSAYLGDLFVGFSGSPLGGPLFHFNLTSNRSAIAPSATNLADRVMDNNQRDGMTEGQPLLFGTGFGIVTDIRTAPNGNLFVLSLTDGRIYEIYRR